MKREEALRLAYKRLAVRSYHSTELSGFLEEKGVPPELLGELQAELRRLGYLDDEAWVEGTVRSLTARKYGPKAIAAKFAAKGIPEEEYLPFLQSCSDDQTAQIGRLLATKYRQRDLSDYKERQKVVAALVRKGYDLRVVLDAVNSDIFEN